MRPSPVGNPSPEPTSRPPPVRWMYTRPIYAAALCTSGAGFFCGSVVAELHGVPVRVFEVHRRADALGARPRPGLAQHRQVGRLDDEADVVQVLGVAGVGGGGGAFLAGDEVDDGRGVDPR